LYGNGVYQDLEIASGFSDHTSRVVGFTWTGCFLIHGYGNGTNITVGFNGLASYRRISQFHLYNQSIVTD
jgi:UDP-N-acetylmuramyl pentapeptide phosphotransferase/UDP-N-acetylglucosamine-1-phosphate transferase